MAVESSQAERIILSHNQLEGPIPPQLYNSSTSLKQVELRDNQLHGNLPILQEVLLQASLGNLICQLITLLVQSLQEICTMLHTSNFLSLASNKLEGQIPACICEQTEYLEALDLSGNKLYGQLPSQFQ
jgi:hypothetical protein